MKASELYAGVITLIMLNTSTFALPRDREPL
jgi:hypothetical protein